MKHWLITTILMVALVLDACATAGSERVLSVHIEPQFGRAQLDFDTLTQLGHGPVQVSVTRLDLLLSNIALRRAGGDWLGLPDWYAYLSLREGRRGFELRNLPAGFYDRMRFQIGVPPAVNHLDPAQYGPAHPLNPNVNGLHWSWQGGYVFLALEGAWQDEESAGAGAADPSSREEGEGPGLSGRSGPASSSVRGGYSYHIANDRLLMTVELPVALDLSVDRELRLALDLDRVFAAPHAITPSEAASSTHSREGDPLAEALRANIEQAFGVMSLRAFSVNVGHRGNRGRLNPGLSAISGRAVPLISSNATPYRLTLPRFFPQPSLPQDNPLTEEGVRLGRELFHDPRLSINNQQSCASCHQTEAALAHAGKRFSLGAEGQVGTRNTMPLFNLAWRSSFFWDGRAPTLRDQVLQPIENPDEMHETLDRVVAKLESTGVSTDRLAWSAWAVGETNHGSDTVMAGTSQDYPSLFAQAFGSPAITADRVARALEQFLLTLTAHRSKFDLVVTGRAKLTDEEQRGFELFHTEYDPRRGQFGADCFHCHGGPLFQSQGFANNGLDAAPRDSGRFRVTRRPGDNGKFAVPSLRNIARTAPYMHDGRFATLEEVIEHYTTGVKRSPTLDPNLAKHPRGGVPLTQADQRALAAFLRTLTDEPQ